MPYGAVAHRNVPRQRALFPLRQRPNRRQTPRVSVGGLAVFLCRFAPWRAKRSPLSTRHAEKTGRAPGSLQKLATVSTPWRRKVRPEPNVVAQWRSRAYHLSTAQLSRAVHVVLLRALPLERGAKEKFRLPLSGVPRACRLQCNSSLRRKRLCLIALRSSTFHYP